MKRFVVIGLGNFVGVKGADGGVVSTGDDIHRQHPRHDGPARPHAYEEVVVGWCLFSPFSIQSAGKECGMMDLVFLAIVAAFAALSWGLVILCERLTGGVR